MSYLLSLYNYVKPPALGSHEENEIFVQSFDPPDIFRVKHMRVSIPLRDSRTR